MYTEQDSKNKNIKNIIKLSLMAFAVFVIVVMACLVEKLSGNAIFVIVAVLILVLFSVAICTVGINRIRDAHLAGGWPQADAEIIGHAVKIYIEPHKSYRLEYYYPEITVRYKFRNSEYEMNTYGLVKGDFRSLEKTDAEKILSEYRVGNSIRVYISPEKPEHSAIIPRMSEYQTSSSWGLIGSGVVVTLLAIGAGVLGAL